MTRNLLEHCQTSSIVSFHFPLQYTCKNFSAFHKEVGENKILILLEKSWLHVRLHLHSNTSTIFCCSWRKSSRRCHFILNKSRSRIKESFSSFIWCVYCIYISIYGTECYSHSNQWMMSCGLRIRYSYWRAKTNSETELCKKRKQQF